MTADIHIAEQGPVHSVPDYYANELSQGRIIFFISAGRNFGTSNVSTRTLDGLEALGSPWKRGTSVAGDLARLENDGAKHADVAAQISLIRRLTGLADERIGELLGCSRQTIHSWKTGGRISDANRARVSAFVDLLQYIDRGTAHENRDIISRSFDGESFVSRASSSDFDKLKELVGRGPGRRSAGWARSQPVTPALPHWFDRLAEAPGAEDVWPAQKRDSAPVKFKFK